MCQNSRARVHRDIEEAMELVLHSHQEFELPARPAGDEEEKEEADKDSEGLEDGAHHPVVGVQLAVLEAWSLSLTLDGPKGEPCGCCDLFLQSQVIRLVQGP